MSNHIRVRVGAIEVEFDSEKTFTREDLLGLTKDLVELQASTGISEFQSGAPQASSSPPQASAGAFTGTTATIAARLGVDNGNDLIVAGAAHLSMVQTKHEFSRSDLLEACRTATGYYRESYGKNFSNYLHSRLKAGDLIEVRQGVFALGAKRKAELESVLAS